MAWLRGPARSVRRRGGVVTLPHGGAGAS